MFHAFCTGWNPRVSKAANQQILKCFTVPMHTWLKKKNNTIRRILIRFFSLILPAARGNVCYVFLHPYLIWLLIYNSLIIQTRARQPCHGFKSLLYLSVLSEPVSFFFFTGAPLRCCSRAHLIEGKAQEMLTIYWGHRVTVRDRVSAGKSARRGVERVGAVTWTRERISQCGNGTLVWVFQRKHKTTAARWLSLRRHPNVAARVCLCVCVDAFSKPGFIVVPRKQTGPSEKGSQQQHRNRLAGCGQHRERLWRKRGTAQPNTDTDQSKTR